MALNAVERKVLEHARRAIRVGKQSYVCHAIRDAYVEDANKVQLRTAKKRLRSYIEQSLEGRTTLGSWLALKTGARVNGYRDLMDHGLQRAARVAWITWMLGEEICLSSDTERGFARYMKKGRRK